MLAHEITPANMAEQISICMTAAGIGSMVSALEGSRVVFDDSIQTDLEVENLIEIIPGPEQVNLSQMVARSSAEDGFSRDSPFVSQVNELHAIAEGVVRQKKKRGNYRKEANEASARAKGLYSVLEEKDAKDRVEKVAMAIFESALIASRLTRPDDRLAAKDLFMMAMSAFGQVGKWTKKAVAAELAAGMLDGIYEMVPVKNGIELKAAGAWERSLREYTDPASERLRIFRSLVYCRKGPSHEMRIALIRALTDRDMEDGRFADFCRNNVRLGHLISEDGAEVKSYRWRDVKESFENAAMIWRDCDEDLVDVQREIMILAQAATAFTTGKTVYYLNS